MYDAAERVVVVASNDPLNSGQYRPSKEFTYGTSGMANGKLISGLRHNYHASHDQILFGDLKVTESYGYNDALGHLTDKTTTIGSVDLGFKNLSQTYHYNDLEQIDDTTYPVCVAPGPGCGQAVWGDVAQSYTNGFVTSITQPAFATGISYWPSGMTNVVTHAASKSPAPTLTDTYAMDTTTQMSRPSAITFSSWTDGCVAPVIQNQPGNVTMWYGDSAQALSVTTSLGTNPTYQWYVGTVETGTKISGAINSVYPLPASPQNSTTQYSVLVINGCGRAESVLVTVTVLLPAPTQLHVATASTSTLRITWSGVNGVQFELHRIDKYGGATTSNASSPFTDTVTQGSTYVYEVRATLSGYSSSAYSARDLGTTISLVAVSSGSVIAAADVNTLLDAMNDVRAAVGASSLGWSQILPSGTPAPDHNIGIYATHITSLRANMDAALRALQLPTSGYSDPNLATGSPVRAVHITDLQNRARHTQ